MKKNIYLAETAYNTYARYERNKITLVRMYSIISSICAYAHTHEREGELVKY